MTDIDVVAEELRNFARYLWHEPANDLAGTIKRQATEQGCCQAGFTGLLSPIAGGMQVLAGMVTELCDTAAQRVNRVGDALMATADEYQHTDAQAKERMEHQRPGERTAS
jgi:hypothetical protein